MTDLEYEFEQLKERHRRAQEYFKNKYDSDTPEGQKKAQKAFKEIEKRLEELWERIGKKSLELDPNQTEEEWLEELGKQEFWILVVAECYPKSKRAIVRMERPQFWKDPVTKVIDE